jgi:hypothetical protein
MREAIRRIERHTGALFGAALLALPLPGVMRADDAKPANVPESDSPKTDLRQSLVATSPASQPLNLFLTQAELRAIVSNYEVKTGDILTSPFDEEEVIVTAPHELAPMRDVSQAAWGGIAAPFWAIMHPKDAWRILLPIPPK